MHPLLPYFELRPVHLFLSLDAQIPGILLALGVLLGSAECVAMGRKYALPATLVPGFLPWLYAGLFIGSRVGELLFYHPSALFVSYQAVLQSLRGESSTGAFIGASLCGYIYIKIKSREDDALLQAEGAVLRFSDAMLYGMTLGWFFGRLGCFTVHDHPGIETNFWLGMYGICPSRLPDMACHDLGLYEAGLVLALYLSLRFFRGFNWSPGYCTAYILSLYAVGRFALEFLRHPLTDARYFGFTPAQYASCLMLGLAIGIILKIRTNKAVQIPLVIR